MKTHPTSPFIIYFTFLFVARLSASLAGKVTESSKTAAYDPRSSHPVSIKTIFLDTSQASASFAGKVTRYSTSASTYDLTSFNSTQTSPSLAGKVTGDSTRTTTYELVSNPVSIQTSTSLARTLTGDSTSTDAYNTLVSNPVSITSNIPLNTSLTTINASQTSTSLARKLTNMVSNPVTIKATNTTSNIPLNASLTTVNPTQTWSSPSSTFSLRFLPTQNTTTFTLSITYNPLTPIWTAPVPVNTPSTLLLHSSGDLRLISETNAILWHSNTSNLGITHATLDDTGNFMLMNNSDHIIWSTFDHPTDTLVQLQNFTVGMKLSSGLYSFSLNHSGNMNLHWNNTINYYTLGLNNSDVKKLSSKPRLMLEQIGYLALLDSGLSKLVIMAYGSDYSDTGIFRFVRLDNDGNLRIYRVDQGSNAVNVKWTALTNECLIFGYCGNMGICSYSETGPVCGCASENFDAVDEKDSKKGCRLKEEVKNCPGNETLLQMNNTMFLNYPPEFSDVYYMGSTNCRYNCLTGQSCVVSISLADGSGQCYVKTENFVSGYQAASVPSTSFVKVCGPVVLNPAPLLQEGTGSKRLKRWVIGVVVLVTVVVLLLFEGSLWWWCCRRRREFGSLSAQYALLEYASGAPVQFSYKELQQATNGFKEKLGEGGFGTVYKGVLANKTVCAVKQLEGIEQGEKQFRMEVATISSTHHLNLVRLIGFCSEGRHRLLVYEFMKNGSLDSFLFGSGKLLTWENRFNIALGTAKGITYLHEECRDCIVHCDIKPENILLDDSYNAKVSDFGLAKLVNPKDHRYRTLTSVRGTRGYLAPEWLANLPITAKSDIYSFGMVLLEIVSGRRNFAVSDETNRKKFTVWAYEEFDRGNVRGVVDPRLDISEVDISQVTRAIQVGFWCIQEQTSQRPTMGKVVQMLEGIMEIRDPPPPKAVTDGLLSDNLSSFNAHSIAIASGPGQSSSSFRTPRDLERPTSSL